MGQLRKLHISPQLIVLDTEIADSTLHTISPSFAQHLELSVRGGGVIGKNPLDVVNMLERDGRRDVAEYIAHKLSGMNKKYAALGFYRVWDQERYTRSLEDFLATPLHIARMMIYLTNPESPIDSKQEVVETFREVFAFRPDLVDMIDRILAADREYTQFLEQLVREKTDFYREQYEEALERIGEIGRLAVTFTQQNALLIDRGWPQTIL
jgi:hypothetical protein